MCLDVAFGKSDVYRKIDIKLIGVFFVVVGGTDARVASVWKPISIV